MKILKFLINILLLAGVLYMGYILYNNIREPIVFDTESKIRKEAAIEKLKKIRTAQLAYKKLHGNFANEFDSLIYTIKTDSFEVMKLIGDPNDTTVVSTREITKVAMLDSLFKGDVAEAENLAEVPIIGKDFDLQAQTTTKNEVEIPVFQAWVKYDDLYKGLKKKYFADKLGFSLQVGDIREASTSGNWE